MPEISVIIPTCNRPQYLNRTLATLVRQSTRVAYEILVLDDHEHNQQTIDIVKFWGLQKPIRYLKPSTYGVPKGRTRIRNLGIKEAMGKILIFLDDDMLTPSNFIEEHYLSHEEKSHKDVIIGYRNHLKVSRQFLEFINPVSLTGDPSVLERLPAIKDERETVYKTCHGDLSRLTAPWTLLFSNNFSVKKKFLNEIGACFNDSFQGAWGGEDIEIGYRLFKGGGNFKLNRKAVGYHQWHYANWRENIRSLKINLKKFLHLHPSIETELYLDYTDIGLDNFTSDLKKYLAVNGDHPLSIWDSSDISENFSSQLRLGKKGKNLIIGVGDGEILKRKNFDVCVDLRRTIVQRWKTKFPKAEWHCMVGIHLPYADGFFESVLVNDFLTLLSPYHRTMVFKEAMRVSKGTVWFGSNTETLSIGLTTESSFKPDIKELFHSFSGLEADNFVILESWDDQGKLLFKIQRVKNQSKGRFLTCPKLAIIVDSEMKDTNSDNAVELALSLGEKGGKISLELENYESESISWAGPQPYWNRLNNHEQKILKSCLNVDLTGIKHQYPRLSFTGNLHYFGSRVEWVMNKPPGILPSHYVHLLNEQVDSVWCPSQSSFDYLKASGVDTEKLAVIPLGVSKNVIEKYRKIDSVQASGPFKFVAIGTIEKSSGLDVVLEAFCEAFRRVSNVALEIRILPLKQRDVIQKEKLHNHTARLDHVKYVERANALSKYRIENWKIYARKKGMDSDRIKFRYLTEGVRVWPSYFKNTDCYVQAHRSDLVGQRILQAMGLGIPVIATGRYLPEELKVRGLNYLIPSKEGSAAEGEWSSDVVYSCWAEPNMDHLIRLMRYVYFNKQESKERGLKARKYVLENLTWDHIAPKIISDLEKISCHKEQSESHGLALLFRGLREKNLINIEEEAYERR